MSPNILQIFHNFVRVFGLPAGFFVVWASKTLMYVSPVCSCWIVYFLRMNSIVLPYEYILDWGCWYIQILGPMLLTVNNNINKHIYRHQLYFVIFVIFFRTKIKRDVCCKHFLHKISWKNQIRRKAGYFKNSFDKFEVW